MKIPKTAVCALLIAALAALGLATLLRPARTFSENENRVLQERPALSASAVLDGGYQKSLTGFLTDQFPGRDGWMALGTRLKLLSGRRDIGGAYIGRDHYYFEKVTDVDESRYEKNLAALEALAEAHPALPFTVMLVPSSGIVLSDKLPAHARMYDAAALYATARTTLTSCAVVDPTAALQSAADGYIYYRTDHHWTTAGAFVGYQALRGGGAALKTYAARTVTDSFLGTLYSKTLDGGAVCDSIDLAEVGGGAAVTADGAAIPLYDLSKLSGKDKYQVFFGGNYGLVELTGCSGQGTLLVLKDSFANCLVPFLTADYARILMVDLRYYPGSVSALLQSERIDAVLTLYELNNFAGDANLAKLAL